MSYKDQFSNVSHQYSKDIKKDDTLNPYSYMLISSGTLYDMFFEIMMNLEPKDAEHEIFSYAAKNKFEKNLNSLKKEEVRKLYTILLYDYIAFVHHFMDPIFKETFPIPFEDFEKEFRSIFVKNKKEEKLLDEIIEKYDSAFHSRKLLSYMKFPKDYDDLTAVETLEELKKMYFHRFNETITNYLRIKLKGGDRIAKKLRKL